MNSQFYKGVLSDLADAIEITKIRIYIFGGFTMDVWENKILRDHHDLDTIGLNFWLNSEKLVSFFKGRGYDIYRVPNGDIKFKKNNFGISMTNCEVNSKIVKWSPYGVIGNIYFPSNWLSNEPFLFDDFSLYTVDKRFEYCLKNNPSYFNSDWPQRDHSVTLNYLKQHLQSADIYVDDFIKEMYRN